MKTRKGSTLVITLMVFMILMIFGTFILGFMLTENKQSFQHQYKTQAYYIARSGAVAVEAAIMDMDEEEIEDMIEKLNKEIIKVDEFKIGVNIVNVELVKIDYRILIHAKSKINDIEETVTKTIDIIEQTKDALEVGVDMALFSNTYMLFESNTQNNVTGNIGINTSDNNSIEFTSGFNDKLTINIPIGSDANNLIKKPDWNKDTPKIAYIEKREYEMPHFPDYPQYPWDIENKGTITTNWDNANPIVNQSGYYDEWYVKSNYSITIDTQNKDMVLRINKFNVEQGHIKIIGVGKVKLFIDNYIRLKGSLNTGGDPKNLEIFYKGDKKLTIDNETNIAGSLYLQKADLNITGGGSFDGNLICGGKNVTISGGSLIQKGVVYAPNSHIKLLAGGKIDGGVIGETIFVKGGVKVSYNPLYAGRIPIIPDTPLEENFIQFQPGHFK